MIKYALDLDALRYAMRKAGFQTQSSLAEASETSNEVISRLFRASGRERRGLMKETDI